MKIQNRDYLENRENSLAIALALANIAGWELDQQPDLLIRGLHDFFLDPVSDLILMPLAANSAAAVSCAIHEIRCDAVMPAGGKTNDNRDTLYASVAIWRSGAINWYRAMRLFHTPGAAEIWLIPDPHAGAADGPCFHLGHHRLRASAPPFQDSVERDEGLLAGDRLIAAQLLKDRHSTFCSRDHTS